MEKSNKIKKLAKKIKEENPIINDEGAVEMAKEKLGNGKSVDDRMDELNKGKKEMRNKHTYYDGEDERRNRESIKPEFREREERKFPRFLKNDVVDFETREIISKDKNFVFVIPKDSVLANNFPELKKLCGLFSNIDKDMVDELNEELTEIERTIR